MELRCGRPDADKRRHAVISLRGRELEVVLARQRIIQIDRLEVAVGILEGDALLLQC